MKKAVKLLVFANILLGTVGCSAPSGSISSTTGSQTDSTAPVQDCVVTFFKHDGTSFTSSVKRGEKVADPGVDDTIPEESRFDGWMNGNELFDFNTVVETDITLTSKCTLYTDIPCVLTVKLPDDYQLSDGEVVRAGNTVNGYYHEVITLASGQEKNGLFTSTLFNNITSFVLLDSNGVKVKDIVDGDSFEFIDEQMTLVPTFEAKMVSVSFDEGTPVQVNIKDGYTLPTERLEDNDTGAFVGWSIDEEGEVYLPGETIDARLLAKLGDNIAFTSVYKEVVEISTWDQLITDQEYDSDSVLSIVNDIDADGEDSGTGIGDGEFNGMILGNGHKISNFTIDKYDDEGNGVGLIDTSADGFQCFDLTLEDCSYSDVAMYGAGALIGEIDAYSYLKNVTVRNLTIDKLSDFYAAFSDTIYGVTFVGGLVGCNFGAGSKFVNCTVDNFDSTYVIDYSEGIEDGRREITVGGLIGCDNGEDEKSSVITDCKVINSTLAAPNHSNAKVGGLVGLFDGEGALEYINNKVENTTISVSDLDCGSIGSPSTSVGGLIGDCYIYCRNTVEDSYYPNSISNNVIDNVDISVNVTKDTDNNIIYAGGLLGACTIDYNGKGSQTNTNRVSISGNKVNADISIDVKGNNQAYAGGLTSVFDMYNSNYCDTVVENNVLNTNISLASEKENRSMLAGVAGSIICQGYSLYYFDSNAVYGSITAPERTSTAQDKALLVSGFISFGLTADANVVIDKAYIDCDMTPTTYAGVMSYYEGDAFGDGGAGRFVFGDKLYVSDKCSNGVYCTDLYHKASEVEGSLLEALGFSSYYWELSEAGKPSLK